jgi:hypothetical protein
MKAYGGVDIQIHVFFTSALHPRGIVGWVGPRTGLHPVQWRQTLPPLGLELRPIGSLARSQLLYRLNYRGC